MDAEIEIAQCIGQIREVFYQNFINSVVTRNPQLAHDYAAEMAEEKVRDLFNKLEFAYRKYFYEKQKAEVKDS